MLKWNLLLAVIMSGSGVSAQSLVLDCDRADVLCTDEFLSTVNQATSLEGAVERLPLHVKRNLTFKRGNNIEKSENSLGVLGPHGHKVPEASESATPAQPRLFVWDETSGFTASWNSGNPEHRAFDRIDLYDFDFATNTHRLMPWHPSGLDKIDERGMNCVQCHGEVQRPIFPMYPDWPQFYGEFNDEMAGYPEGSLALRTDLRAMANEFQPIERAFYLDFLKREGAQNPRYSDVLEARATDSRRNPYYPYRPRNTTSPFSDTSRAFFHRPNLRLGVMYNRLTALQTFEKVKKSPLFQKYPDALFYALLDCNWDFVPGQGEAERTVILNQVLASARELNGLSDINLRGARFNASDIREGERNRYFSAVEKGETVYYRHRSYTEKGYQQIPYEDLLRLLGLKIQDLDIRFRHDSNLKVTRGYNVYDPRAYYFTDSAMDIGYIEPRYALNPVCDNNNKPCRFTYGGTYMDGMRYFNSYFDGSATLNELLAAQILLYLTDVNSDFSTKPELNQVRRGLRARIRDPHVYFETLQKKYANFTARLELDKPFFDKMDKIGPWIQLPFQPDLLNIHNREAFWGSSAKTSAIRLRHAQWANAQDKARNRQNRNGGANICWNVYDVMHERLSGRTR